jgi:hypothetical protein
MAKPTTAQRVKALEKQVKALTESHCALIRELAEASRPNPERSIHRAIANLRGE